MAELVADGMSADSIVNAMEIAVEVHGRHRDEMEDRVSRSDPPADHARPSGAIEICWEVPSPGRWRCWRPRRPKRRPGRTR